MSNMGAGRLILVDPIAAVNVEARQGAAGAQDKLQQRLIYRSLEEFQANELGICIGLCCRQGKYRTPEPIDWVLRHCDQNGTDSRPVYFVFGPEDDGLTTDEIAKLNLTAELPVYGDFDSLNLAQAVLLTLFIAQRTWSDRKFDKILSDDNHSLIGEADDLLQHWLRAMGFDLNHRRGSAIKVARKLLLRGLPQPFELRIFNAILRQNIQMLSGQRRDHCAPTDPSSTGDDL
jgi:tRNA/rRNA methyltransferase